MFCALLFAVTLIPRLALAQPDIGAPTLVPPPLAGDPASAPRTAPDNRYHVLLTDGSHLIGTLQLGKEIALSSTVGDVSIPVEKIAQLRFTEQPSCRVSFHNGDQLSGTLALMTIKIKTIWGVAEIELEHIASIVSQSQMRQYEMHPVPANSPGWTPASPYAEPSYPATGSYAPAPYGPAPPVPLPSPAAPPPTVPAPLDDSP
jgi:hypothetical protein